MATKKFEILAKNYILGEKWKKKLFCEDLSEKFLRKKNWFGLVLNWTGDTGKIQNSFTAFFIQFCSGINIGGENTRLYRVYSR